ncbi:PREDICTED: microfibril-associated glycoprotein 4-like [Nanorana parkeri]|uniref:microfibril-associated glycoprotein 4-like n=1 Tax=Nanorana parkeri TaxID=125878 RepID=UPI00085506A2|nr:PREDICTED: microfibril-associated glycoprotein 4-like [Nanorana parkeri]
MTSDGVYLIYPKGPYSVPVPVYCDMTTPKGPWTVFQKRFDGSETFLRGWEDYKSGFGRADSEYWLGLENIYHLTLLRSYRLRIDLTDFDNDSRFVIYNSFALSPLAISGERDSYKLHIDGFEEGDPSRPAGNSLWTQKNMSFSTHDHDRDTYTGNCASMYKGGSWYSDCHSANLNGLYLRGLSQQYATGMTWAGWRGHYYSMKSTQMKIAVNL